MKIIVLGGGVIGVTSAYYLARAGHEVTLIERRDSCGLETSFANGGQISAGHAAPWASPAAPLELLRSLGREDAPLIFRLRADPRMWAWGLRFLRNCTPHRYAANRARLLRLGAYSRQALGELRQEVYLDYDAQARGMLDVYSSERAFAAAAKHASRTNAEGGHEEVADADRCRAIEPALDGSPAAIAGGIYYPDDESGDAYKFTAGLAKVCDGLGVSFAYGTTVNGVRAKGDRITGVDTSAGDMSGNLYVMALGSYSPLLAASLGVKLPIYPVKGYSATLALNGSNRGPLVNVTDMKRKVVIGRLGDRLRIAGTAEIAGYDLTLNPVRARAVFEAALGLFPAAGDSADAEYWTGLRPMTPDGPPIIGPTRYANLFLNTGHGTLGWTTACGSALILADLVAGQRPAIDLDGLTLDRYRQ